MLIPVFPFRSPVLISRFCAGFAKAAVLSMWLFSLPPAVIAEEGEAFEVQTARFSLQNTLLKFDLTVKIDLPAYINVAVNQGFAVPLMFEVEIYANRNYWLDKKIVTLKQSYLLHFLPMLSSWVVNDVNTGQHHYFDSLDEAVQYMEQVYDYPMLDIGNFDANREFYARARFGIDRERLPRPLKPSAFWPSDWDERSNWYTFEMIALKSGLNE